MFNTHLNLCDFSFFTHLSRSHSNAGISDFNKTLLITLNFNHDRDQFLLVSDWFFASSDLFKYVAFLDSKEQIFTFLTKISIFFILIRFVIFYGLRFVFRVHFIVFWSWISARFLFIGIIALFSLAQTTVCLSSLKVSIFFAIDCLLILYFSDSYAFILPSCLVNFDGYLIIFLPKLVILNKIFGLLLKGINFKLALLFRIIFENFSGRHLYLLWAMSLFKNYYTLI